MKIRYKFTFITLILVLILPSACSQDDMIVTQSPTASINTSQNPELKEEKIINIANPISDNKLAFEWKFDVSGKFSYLAYIPNGESKPFFNRSYEFTENLFIYETEIDGSIYYGFMDVNFDKISYPVFSNPTLYSNGFIHLYEGESRTILGLDMSIIQEYYPGFIISNNQMIETYRNNRIDELPYTTDTENPEEILVPAKLFLKDSLQAEYLVGFTSLDKVLLNKSLSETDFLIPPIFEEAKLFYQNIAAVKVNGKWGYINEDGDVLIDFIYDDAGNFSEGVAGVYLEGEYDDKGRLRPILKWAIINMDGELLTQFEFEYIGNFLNGPAIVDYSYDSIYPSQAYIKADGSKILKIPSVTECLPMYSDENIRVFDMGYYFVDFQGDKINARVYKNAGKFNNGLAAIKPNDKNSWGYINRTGDVVIEVKYYYAGDFSQGYAYVVKDIKEPGYLIDQYENKFLEELNLIGISKFNEDGYAIAYGKRRGENTEASATAMSETVYYMIHIE